MQLFSAFCTRLLNFTVLIADEPPAKKAATEQAAVPPLPPAVPTVGEGIVLQQSQSQIPPPPGGAPTAAPGFMPHPQFQGQMVMQQAAPQGSYATPQYGPMGYTYGVQVRGGPAGMPVTPHPGMVPGAPPPVPQGLPPPHPPNMVHPPGSVSPLPRPAGPPRGPPGVIQAPPARVPGPVSVPAPAPSPPPGGALFPIGPSTTTSTPVGPATSLGQTEPQAGAPGTNDLDLIWKDEDFSMEERRAELPKFAIYLQNGARAPPQAPPGVDRPPYQ